MDGAVALLGVRIRRAEMPEHTLTAVVVANTSMKS